MTTVTPDAPHAADTLLISSDVVGEVLMPPEALMRFPTPLFGLPDQREYALLPAARAGLWWLQAIGDSGLTFLLADPFTLDADYGLDLADKERDLLQLTSPTDAFTLVMLTLPAQQDGTDASSATVTANFRAPIVFNLAEQVGLQVVARDDRYSLRQPIDLTVFPRQEDGLRMR